MIKKWFAKYRFKYGGGRARRNAIITLANGNAPDLWNILNEAMKDSEWLVRFEAVRNLGTKFGMDAIDILITALDDEDADVRKRAVESIVELGQKAVPPLIHLTKSHAPNTRILAIRTLGNIGDPLAIEPLIELLTDENPEVSWEAALALEKIPERELVLNYLKDLASTRSSVPAVAYLEAQYDDTEMSAQIQKSVPSLITYLQHKEGNPMQRLAAAKALDLIGGPLAIKALLGVIDDQDDRVSFVVIKALARMRDTITARIALDEWDAIEKSKRYRDDKVVRRLLVAARETLDSDELKPIIEDQPDEHQKKTRKQLENQLDNMIDRYSPDMFGG